MWGLPFCSQWPQEAFWSACRRPRYARPRRQALQNASRGRFELKGGPHESPGDLHHPIYPTDYPICISPLLPEEHFYCGPPQNTAEAHDSRQKLPTYMNSWTCKWIAQMSYSEAVCKSRDLPCKCLTSRFEALAGVLSRHISTCTS